jgi:hypothetical protein
VFTDLTEEHRVIALICFIDLFAWFNVSEEITSLAIKLDLLSVGDEELLWAVEVLDISGVIHLVWYLIVNEDAVRSLTSEEIFEELGELW